MPRTTIEILEGRTLDQKRALAKEVGEAVSECLNVPLHTALIRIDEVEFENFAQNGELRCDTSLRMKKPAFGDVLEPRITIQFFAGRPLDQKRALVKRVTEKCVRILGVMPEDVRIFLLEMPWDTLATEGIFASDSPDPEAITMIKRPEI